ncbi:hypothetical protein RN001_005317 [Aquatica leii]|uniref:ATP synthase mitochondrial F1 complex assembly factor 1 n=1 Tax=Aquatica leii TaxID=1421715 RepID=A0AAN7SPT9_9COLE|nr:hypothetical protein RN001_005317 [Aquatica leii]
MTTPKLQKNVEKATEQLKTNPYYEKYATKIATLQQTSPEEFLSRIEANEKVKSPKQSSDLTGQYSSLLEPKKQIADIIATDETLNKIMKIELIQDKTAEEISTIWNDYHKNKDFICATIPPSVFDVMNKNSQKYPTFLFPIPRSQGYEFIICQFFCNTVHFTPLLNYQVHKENAPECLTIVHYMEFKDSKGIVLMRGEFNKNVINVQEAQCLANQLQLYYSQNIPEKDVEAEHFFKPKMSKDSEVKVYEHSCNCQCNLCASGNLPVLLQAIEKQDGLGTAHLERPSTSKTSITTVVI